MTPKEEKRIELIRKARYFTVAMVLYMVIVFVFYLIISLIHALVYLKPAVRIISFIAAFILSELILRNVMRIPAVREIAGM